jgi:hypothetical protein
MKLYTLFLVEGLVTIFFFLNFKFEVIWENEKPFLQSIFFPAKITFSKILKKNLAGKNYFAKE